MYKLLYNYSDFLVISKFSGVNFHISKDSEGLCSVIKKKEKLLSLYPIHRLDKLTSGLMVFAKNRKAASELSLLLKSKRIEKYYIAISNNKPKKSQGLILGDMKKSRRGSWKILRTKMNPAVTYFFSNSYSNGLRIFIVKPVTGKTHQIRVALKSLSSPVLGDQTYSKKESHRFDRGYLHAYALRFNYNGKQFCFLDKPEDGILFNDDEFRKALKSYESPWDLKWPVCRWLC